MKYNIDWLINFIKSGHSLNYIFFNSHKPNKNSEIDKNCLSQFWKCEFIENEIEYSSTEQYMMAKKAELFGDKDIWEEILNTDSAYEIKKLGRKVRNFNENTWEKSRYKIVINGNHLKFTQNKELKDFLIATNDSILVEASQYDTIWGIGMKESHKDIENPYKWEGLNLLGFALMKVRDKVNNN